MKSPLPLLWVSICAVPLCAIGSSRASLPKETKSDTVSVSSAELVGGFPLLAPFASDSVNLSGQAFDPAEVFKYNAGLIYSRNSAAEHIVQTGKALDSCAVSVLRFTVDADRWRTAWVRAPKIKRFETFLNGEKINDGWLRFRPGRSEVAMLVYGGKEARDTFDVSLVGDSIATLRLNAKDKRLFSFDDMVHGKRFYGVGISPSGRYVMTHYSETLRSGKTQYSSVLTDLKTRKTIVRDNEYNRMSWLPKRDVLYFTRKTDEGKQLVTLDPATLSERVLAQHLPEGSLTIAPNEKFAIAVRNEEGPRSGELKELRAPDDRQPGWRDRTALYLVDFSSGYTRRLTFGKTSVYLNDISPDGTRLLLTRGYHDLTKKPFDRTDVYEMHLADGKVDTLLTQQEWLDGGDYSPDGRSILFKGSPSAFGGIGSSLPSGEVAQSFDKRLYLYDRATKAVKPLLKDFAPSVGKVKWNPGDGNIYMRCTDGFDETLWRLDPRTGRRFRFELPVTMIQDISVSETSRTPRAVFFGQTGTTSRNAYVADLSGVHPKSVSFGEVSFARELGDVRVASCTPWTFKRTEKDTVAGFYFLPADFDAKKKYPMLVYYYGGCVPTARALEYHYPLSVLANMGYVVLALEPSGAIGYGEEFAARHINTWGKRSGDDIIDATKAFMAQHAFVNTKKVGCMGASYGGFMTEYLQTRTDIFAAAVSHAGISNIASYWGGGYWGHTYGETAQYGSYPWNNPDLYVKQSALFNADKIKTPLLLLHGTADTNVPTNESQQLFTALRILGRPVSYIQIEGADHVITDYTKRMAWQQAIMAWFAKYLQDDDLWWKGLGYGE